MRKPAHFGVLLCLALGWGCSKQQEGERCDINNGPLGDCETGLVCRGEAQLSIQGRGYALCCPSSGESSVDACQATAVLPPEEPPPVLPDLPEPDAGGPPEITDAGEQPDASGQPDAAP